MLDAFILARKPRWDRLSLLLGKVRSGHLRRMSPAEIEEFGLLYRETSSDLALAHREFADSSVTRYLNTLLAQAHPYVYSGRAEKGKSFRFFFAAEFPQAFRRNWLLVLLSCLAFVLPAVLSYVLVMSSPAAKPALVPPGIEDRIEEVRRTGSWADIPAADSSLAASTIMTNNIRVAIMAFGGGVLIGLPTLFVLIINGIMLGSVAAVAQQGGVAMELWSFVSPHGWIELTVIFIAGGAGLGMGRAILLPGLKSRKDSLVSAAHEALRLLLGGAALLVVAGVIEGVVSPSSLQPQVKFVLGVTTGLALYSYLLLAGRGDRDTEVGPLVRERILPQPGLRIPDRVPTKR